MKITFNNFTINTKSFTLEKDGVLMDVEPKVYDLIVCLIENRDKVLTRQELFDRVWQGRLVSDTSLSNRIKSARKLLGDDGQSQHTIKTIHGRGYQFIGKITQPNTKTSCQKSNKSQIDGPLIAVLPLQNMSSDSEQDFLAEGLSEDLTTELFRFKQIQVIDRHTAFQFNSKSLDVKRLSNDLNVDYFIEGSVRLINDRVRINIQLIDTKSSSHVWAEKYDDLFENIYNIQDEIIEQVVSTVTSEILRIETHRALSRSSKNLRAYEHFLRGMYYHKTSNFESLDHNKALVEFEKAIELDENFARARVWMCCARFSVWGGLSPERLALQIEDVKKALSLDNNESECHRLLGALYYYNRDYELAEHHHNQAMNLAPNDANIIIKAASFLALIGQCDKALKLANRAIRLNPLHPAWYWSEIGIIYYSLDKFKSAIAAFEKNTQNGDYDYAMLAACHMALNEKNKARVQSAKALKINPKASASRYIQFRLYHDNDKNQVLIERMVASGISV